MSLQLFLYSQDACAPCERAEAIMAGLTQQYDCVCYMVKINDEPELLQRYGARVPVLEYKNTTLSELELDKQWLENWLLEQTGSGPHA